MIDRLQHAWSAFRSVNYKTTPFTGGSIYPGHKMRVGSYSRSKFAGALFNRIALDVAMTEFQHVKVDEKTDDHEPMPKSGLTKMFSVEANIDQTSAAFMQDLVHSMFDEGVVAAVPVDIDIDTSPSTPGAYEIDSIRVGRITQWYPEHVRVMVYNDTIGREQEIYARKADVAIIENPLYSVINGPNSTLSRLLTKMNLVDNLDEMMASGRLDMLIQLPYALKTESKQKAAEERIKSIEQHLTMGKNGIAYIDGTEKVIQLNRPANSQVNDNLQLLKEEFYNQMGMTQKVMNGTATESEMRLYYTRSIDPIVKAITEEFTRKFLSKTARTQGHTIVAYRSPFNLVPLQQIAELGDALVRNRILTPNELRALIGFRPHSDPSADKLFNPNMPIEKQPGVGTGKDKSGSITPPEELEKNDPQAIQNGDNTNEEGTT